LIPYARNARTAPRQQFAQIRRLDRREFGFTHPVLIDEEERFQIPRARTSDNILSCPEYAY